MLLKKKDVISFRVDKVAFLKACSFAKKVFVLRVECKAKFITPYPSLFV